MKNICNVHDYQKDIIKAYRDNPEVLEFDDYILLKGEKCGLMQLCSSKDAKVVCGKRDYTQYVPGSEERLETVYDTEKVFNRESYENSKKYQDKVKRWLNYFEKHSFEIRDLTEENLEDVSRLYKEWYELKELDEPMIRRYQNCIDLAYDKTCPTTYIIGMFDEEKKLVGFRVVSQRDDGWAFDLSNSVTRSGYKYLSEIFQVNTLKYLKDVKGVKYYNLGLSDGSLRLHKTLLPNFDLPYYVIR